MSYYRTVYLKLAMTTSLYTVPDSLFTIHRAIQLCIGSSFDNAVRVTINK